jgi:hypothetical protein
VDPVPDPLFHRISGSARNRTRTSGSVARNCDEEEGVCNFAQNILSVKNTLQVLNWIIENYGFLVDFELNSPTLVATSEYPTPGYECNRK